MTLKRTTPLRRSPIRQQGRRLQERARRARVNTGPRTGQREAVLDRSLGCCEICGRRLFDFLSQTFMGAHSIHHRQPRGMGGTTRAEINSPANLLLLCGDATTPGGCHAHVESNRADAYRHGWLVRASANPADVPVLLEGGDRYLLTDSGDRIEVVGGGE